MSKRYNDRQNPLAEGEPVLDRRSGRGLRVRGVLIGRLEVSLIGHCLLESSWESWGLLSPPPWGHLD